MDHQERAERPRRLEHSLSQGARLLELALGDEHRGQDELSEGPASCSIALPQGDDALGLAPGLAEVPELSHAASRFAGERTFVETTDPRGRLLGMASPERLLRLDEKPCAFPGLLRRSVTSGLHGEQLSLELGLWGMATQRFAARPREPNGTLRLVTVVGEVAHAGENVGAELNIVAQLDEGEGSVEVLLCDGVPTGVMGHPPGHLGQGRGRREEGLAPSAVGIAEETWANLSLQIVDDCGVQVATSDPLVGGTECAHGGGVSARIAPRAVVHGQKPE